MKTTALLTEHYLNSLKPRKREYLIYDAGCDGLAIRVQPGGPSLGSVGNVKLARPAASHLGR